jgi:DNA-binding GntR family transcriptional regulator
LRRQGVHEGTADQDTVGGNPLNSILLAALRTPVEASSSIHFDDRRSESELTRVIDAHEAVVDRICSGDAMGAVSAMTYHFDISIVHVARRETGEPRDVPPAVVSS